jgi:hypothetical protein
MDAFSGTPPTPPYSIPPSAAAAAASSVTLPPNAANPSDAGNPAAATRALFAPLRAGSTAASTNEQSAAGATVRRPIRRTYGVRRSAGEVKTLLFI